MLSEIYNDRPKTIQSGAPLEFKVKVQHRSDILMQEQVNSSVKPPDISCTQSPNLNVFRPVLQLCLASPLKPGVEWRMKM